MQIDKVLQQSIYANSTCIVHNNCTKMSLGYHTVLYVRTAHAQRSRDKRDGEYGYRKGCRCKVSLETA